MRGIRPTLRTGTLLLLSAALTVGLVGTTPATAVSTATVTETLNVRSGPGTAYRVLGVVKQGQRVTTLRTNKGWTTIEFRDRTGFVASKYLRATGSAPVSSTAVVAGTPRARP